MHGECMECKDWGWLCIVQPTVEYQQEYLKKVE